MKMRYSLLTGLAAGYYLGTMSPEQIKANVTSLAEAALKSPVVSQVAEKAKDLVGSGTEKAQGLVGGKISNLWPL